MWQDEDARREDIDERRRADSGDAIESETEINEGASKRVERVRLAG